MKSQQTAARTLNHAGCHPEVVLNVLRPVALQHVRPVRRREHAVIAAGPLGCPAQAAPGWALHVPARSGLREPGGQRKQHAGACLSPAAEHLHSNGTYHVWGQTHHRFRVAPGLSHKQMLKEVSRQIGGCIAPFVFEQGYAAVSHPKVVM